MASRPASSNAKYGIVDRTDRWLQIIDDLADGQEMGSRIEDTADAENMVQAIRVLTRQARNLARLMLVQAPDRLLVDLAAYKAKERTPLRGKYRGYEIISMPPPSSGGIVLLDAPVIAGWRAHSLQVMKATGLMKRVSPGRVARRRRHEWPSREAFDACLGRWAA